MPSHDLMRMLRWDAKEAAQQTGTDHPVRLQRGLQGDHRIRLGAVLSEMGDSYFGQSWEDFARLVDELGFALLDYTPYYLNGPGEQRLWVHARGALLLADSYSGMVNQARLWMCWNPSHQDHERWPPGIKPEDMERDYWYGGLDVRDGLRTRWGALMESGDLISPWPVPLRPWPFHAAESPDGNQHLVEEMVMCKLLAWPAAARKIMSLG